MKLDDSAKFCHPVPISDRREKICQLAGKTLLSLLKKLVHHALFHASIVGRVIFTNQFLGKTRSRPFFRAEDIHLRSSFIRDTGRTCTCRSHSAQHTCDKHAKKMMSLLNVNFSSLFRNFCLSPFFPWDLSQEYLRNSTRGNSLYT